MSIYEFLFESVLERFNGCCIKNGSIRPKNKYCMHLDSDHDAHEKIIVVQIKKSRGVDIYELKNFISFVLVQVCVVLHPSFYLTVYVNQRGGKMIHSSIIR